MKLRLKNISPGRSRGLTLMEAMFFLVVVSIVAVAAGVGLQAVAKVPAATNEIMSINNVLVNAMEQTHASLSASWPSTTYTGSIVVGDVTYSPSVTIHTTAYDYGSPPTYTSVTNLLSLNSKTYQLSMTVDQADPAGGSTYKTDYYRVTLAVTPYVNGSLATTGQTTLVTYFAQP